MSSEDSTAQFCRPPVGLNSALANTAPDQCRPFVRAMLDRMDNQDKASEKLARHVAKAKDETADLAVTTELRFQNVEKIGNIILWLIGGLWVPMVIMLYQTVVAEPAQHRPAEEKPAAAELRPHDLSLGHWRAAQDERNREANSVDPR